MVEGAKDRHGSAALLYPQWSATQRHILDAPPLYAKPESSGSVTSIEFFHPSPDAANMIKSWHPFQYFRGYFSSNFASKGKSSDVHNISKDYSSLSGSSKPLLPFSGLLEASSDPASNLRNSVLNFRWGELDGIPAFPASAVPGKAVTSALSSFNSVVMEVKQAYGTSTEAIQNVKRRLVDAFSSYFQNQKRTIDQAADHSSSQRGIVADGNAGSTRTAMLTSAHFIRSESAPSSPPSTATTPQNGRVVVHLRSRL